MELSINHQLIYKKFGEGIRFYAKSPKSAKGIRDIPITNELAEQLVIQKQNQEMLGIKSDCIIDGSGQK